MAVRALFPVFAPLSGQLGTEYHTPAARTGKLRMTAGWQLLPNPSNIGSTITFPGLPSGAILVPGLSRLYWQNTTASATMSVGTGSVAGVAAAPAALLALTSIATAGSAALTQPESLADSPDATIAWFAQPLWRQAGHASDPQVRIPIVLTTAGANITTAGRVGLLLVWAAPES